MDALLTSLQRFAPLATILIMIGSGWWVIFDNRGLIRELIAIDRTQSEILARHDVRLQEIERAATRFAQFQSDRAELWAAFAADLATIKQELMRVRDRLHKREPDKGGP